MTEARLTSPRARRRSDAAFAIVWHLVFAGAVGATWGGLAWLGVSPTEPTALALALAGGAAGLGAAVSLAGGVGRTLCVLIWGMAGAAAGHLTGGIAGPLAALCLAPAAAATLFRSRDLLALGAATALGATFVSALDTSLLTLPAAPAVAAPWLSLLALVSVTAGFAAGLIRFQGDVRRDGRRKARSEALLDILDHQPLLFALMDRNGRVLSAAGARLGGFDAFELEGRSLGHLAAEPHLPALAAALHTAARDGQAQVWVETPDDPEGWLEISLRARDETTLIAAVRDARGQRSREQELEAARLAAEQQNAGKTRFLANMSHELRTPLNAIMGFSDIMRQRLFGQFCHRCKCQPVL